MANAMLNARQEGDSQRRIEVITGQSRRRRWTAEEKARIVAESFETDANISEVARRNGVARGLLTAWRHRFATAARSKVPSFVPVTIDAEESSRGAAGEPTTPPRSWPGRCRSTRDDQGRPLLGPASRGRATRDFLRNAHADIPAVVEAMRQYWMPTRYARAS